MEARTYRRVTEIALVLLVVIVVTGAGVRLTGSGLGCTDWPRCTDTTFTPSSDLHAWIEFGNRMVTGLVSVAVAGAVLGSMRLRPRRRDLVLLSWGLVAGVVGQIVLGGLVVLSHLNPWLVQGHFVLSMVLVGNAVLLRHRAGRPADRKPRPAVTPALTQWGWGLVGLGALVLATGTLVTGSGPHSGSRDAGVDKPLAERVEAVREIRRLPFSVNEVARVHSVSMILFLAVAIWVTVQIRRHHVGHRQLTDATTALLTVVVLQGALGYAQYFSGVPPLMVAGHVLGASLLWVAVLNLALVMSQPNPTGSLVTGTLPPAQSGGEHAGDLTHRDLVPDR